eukprot:TRINITY_DN482_c0_g1_i1.p1 TRINITY_DN482_c0_g1~~TRINITY_DN482_c0_g1_i1.p1  ORF type:complete len:441 (+),score=115.77 TRINITY_DN482_c0_g1_i1:60-1382(+)
MSLVCELPSGHTVTVALRPDATWGDVAAEACKHGGDAAAGDRDALRVVCDGVERAAEETVEAAGASDGDVVRVVVKQQLHIRAAGDGRREVGWDVTALWATSNGPVAVGGDDDQGYGWAIEGPLGEDHSYEGGALDQEQCLCRSMVAVHPVEGYVLAADNSGVLCDQREDYEPWATQPTAEVENYPDTVGDFTPCGQFFAAANSTGDACVEVIPMDGAGARRVIAGGFLSITRGATHVAVKRPAGVCVVEVASGAVQCTWAPPEKASVNGAAFVGGGLPHLLVSFCRGERVAMVDALAGTELWTKPQMDLYAKPCSEGTQLDLYAPPCWEGTLVDVAPLRFGKCELPLLDAATLERKGALTLPPVESAVLRRAQPFLISACGEEAVLACQSGAESNFDSEGGARAVIISLRLEQVPQTGKRRAADTDDITPDAKRRAAPL